MDKPGRQGDSPLNLAQLDRNEPSWQRASSIIFWILLFRLVSP